MNFVCSYRMRLVPNVCPGLKQWCLEAWFPPWIVWVQCYGITLSAWSSMNLEHIGEVWEEFLVLMIER